MSLIYKQCAEFYRKCSLNPFDKPLSQRGWEQSNVSDVWGIVSDIPFLLEEGNEQALDEWVNSLQARIGLPPRINSEIKEIVRKAWEKDDTLEEYGDLLYLIRQYVKTDPVWIERNQIKNRY